MGVVLTVPERPVDPSIYPVQLGHSGWVGHTRQCTTTQSLFTQNNSPFCRLGVGAVLVLVHMDHACHRGH